MHDISNEVFAEVAKQNFIKLEDNKYLKKLNDGTEKEYIMSSYLKTITVNNASHKFGKVSKMVKGETIKVDRIKEVSIYNDDHSEKDFLIDTTTVEENCEKLEKEFQDYLFWHEASMQSDSILKKALTMHLKSGKTYREISETLKVPSATLRTKVNRFTKLMRSKYNDNKKEATKNMYDVLFSEYLNKYC